MSRRAATQRVDALFGARARPRAEQEGATDDVLNTTSLADKIAFRLQTSIVARTIRPGTRLRQEDLCVRFKVNRTPVREAPRKLQALRLVVMMANRGTVVRIPSRAEIAEAYDLRAELEGYAAECACRRATAETDRALAAAMGSLRRRGRDSKRAPLSDAALSIDMSEAVRGFHHVIHDWSGSDRLAR